jgi:hypothetical protein
MKERLIELINKEYKDTRSYYKEFSERTGIKKETVRSLCDGRQKFNEEHIEAIASAFPKYKHWLVFGEELPICGQISPRSKDKGSFAYKPMTKIGVVRREGKSDKDKVAKKS